MSNKKKPIKKQTRQRRAKGIPYTEFRQETGIWEVRGTHPTTGIRFRESQGPSGTEEIAEARRLEIETTWNNERVHGSKAVATFGDALDFYLENKDGGSMNRYFPDILEEFGDVKVSDLKTKDIKDWANDKWPNCSGVTKNTQSFNPIITVLRYAAQNQVCMLPLFSKFDGKSKTVKAAPEEWIKDFLNKTKRLKLKALVFMLTTTAARCIDARRLRWDTVNWQTNEITFLATKNGDDRTVQCHPALMAMLYKLQESEPEGPFVYKRTDTVNKEIKRECERRGISESYPTHQFGRHAFAERLLDNDVDPKLAKDGGGWKDQKIFDQNYGHYKKTKMGNVLVEQANLVWDKLDPKKDD